MENINELNNLPQPVQLLSAQKVSSLKLYKTLFLIFFILFLIVATVLITLLITKKNTPAVTSKLTESAIPTIIPTATPTVIVQANDITANWKTYKDSAFNYSIKYPSDWVLKNHSKNLISLASAKVNEFLETHQVGGTPNIMVNVYSLSELPNNTENLSFDNWIKQQEDQNLFSNKESIIVDGQNGYSVNSVGESATKEIYINKNNVIYHISYDLPVDDQEELRIINTFKLN